MTGEAFDKSYAEAIGANLAHIDFGEPLETIEDLFEDLDAVVTKATKPTLYILDSLDSLSDRAEMKRDMDAGSYGMEKHRKLSRLFRQSAARMSKFITLIIVSQVRAKIGGFGYGPKVEPTGGFALKFYSSQRLMLAQTGTISKTISGIKLPYGIKIKGKVIKNKIGLAFREAEFRILFGYGTDDVDACLDYLAKTGGLKSVLNGMKEPAYADMLMNKTGDHRNQLKKLHNAVEKKWYSIEQSFLPMRRKYE